MKFKTIKDSRPKIPNSRLKDTSPVLYRDEVLQVMDFLRDNVTVVPTEEEVRIAFKSYMYKKPVKKMKKEKGEPLFDVLKREDRGSVSY